MKTTTENKVFICAKAEDKEMVKAMDKYKKAKSNAKAYVKGERQTEKERERRRQK